MDNESSRSSCYKIKNCCSVFSNNCELLCSHIAAKLRDDLLIGTEHSYKVIPKCNTPQQVFIRESGKLLEAGQQEMSSDEKKNIVLADPKFGMFSLFKYHVTRGYRNEMLIKKNAVYCSHIFSLLTFLPILIFCAQWAIYIALVTDEAINTGELEFCPNQANWRQKLIMFGACALYFVKSFFLWDNLTDRTRLNKMVPATDTWTMIDTFQEFGFNLFVYAANIWIIFNGHSVSEMVMDCLAMEFLMNLDNEFESLYFEYLPEAADDIYDNVFISYTDNYKLLEKKENHCSFYCLHCLTFIPFKVLLASLLLFPVFCFFMMVYAPLCK